MIRSATGLRRSRHQGMIGRRLLATAAACALTAISAHAAPGPVRGPTSKLIDSALIETIRSHAIHEVVLMATRNQNVARGQLSSDEIDALDKQWRAEREAQRKPLISGTLSNALSAYLTRIQAHSLGLYSEIFVMDRNGLNVGQSAITSDYWQGDEAKFQRTFSVGPTAVFVDEAEYHEGSDTWRAQVNLTIADPATKESVGAATFEINLTELQRRKAR